MLWSITIRIPFLEMVLYADSDDFYDLVSIIVDENTYDWAKSEIDRYSKDISWVLDNTRVVIMPVPEDVTAYEIASMNEALYFDWYKEFSNVSFESKLVWTVLIWNIPLAYAEKDGQTSKTILPYTDFENKSYIYDKSKWYFSYNSENIEWIKPEIWHWVISPNTWDDNLDLDYIKSYFDKNNDYYESNWIYSNTQLSMNWKDSSILSDEYEPYVFYFDSFRESSWLNYNSYIWYKWYLENKEDITYKRFTKELANKLKSQILWNSNSQISDLAKKVDPNISQELLDSVDNSLDNVPDIQSRYIINNSIKSFVETFSKWAIWELRKNVYNAGRYNYWQEVNVDFIPYLITILDVLNDEIIKDFNDDFENQIDELVKNWLSRNIAVPTTYYYEDGDEKSTYTNYLFWNKWTNLVSAEQCSIYRWSLDNWWTLVEANRGLNINNIQVDQWVLDWLPISWTQKAQCYSRVQSWTAMNWINWMNTPFNLDQDASADWELKLKNSNYKGSITPLFDMGWAKAIDDESKTNNPFYCIDNNYLLSNKEEYLSEFWWDSSSWATTYKLGQYTSNVAWYFWWMQSWSCNSTNNAINKVYSFTDTFDQNYINFDFWFCEDNKIYLDWVLVKSWRYEQLTFTNDYDYTSEVFDEDLWENVFLTTTFSWDTYECDGYYITDPDWNVVDNSLSLREINTYRYKSIPSYIMHKSPEPEDLTTQLDVKVTPSLPVDKDRYIDFIAANGSYQKIKYPYLYRLEIDDKSDLSIEKVSEALDEVLDEKSYEINQIIQESIPNSWWSTSNNNSTWETWSIADFFSSLWDVFDWSVDNPWEYTSWLTNNSKFIDNPEIYELLKTWTYPQANFDLKQYLKSKWTTTLELWGESKTLSYYDVLVFAIYWNNLNSVSAKYWFVFENYLSDQNLWWEEYFLPKNKSQYEIAYLWAPGSVTDMYIWLDPESKWENPYSDIIWNNQDISTKILWLNVWTSNSYDEWLFKCAPPEWVPIWEWIPAVMCRLWEMLPPTIKISDWACWPSLLSNEEKEELEQCNWDVNKNWVNDCLETKLSSWNIVLESDSSKYNYNKNISLKASIKSEDWNVLTYLWATDIKFELLKVEASVSSEESIDSWSKEIIFDSSSSTKSDYSLLEGYLSFEPLTIKSSAWVSNHMLTTKNRDLNIYLKASINIYDSEWNLNISKESEELEIKVRWDRLFNSSYKLDNSSWNLDIISWSNFVKANSNSNIYLFDGNINSIESIKNLINNNSTSQEKLAIKLENFDRWWNPISIAYPVNIILSKDWETIEERELNASNIWSFAELFSLTESWEYKLVIIDSNWSSTNRNIDVTAWNPSKIDLELSTTIMEIWWNVSTNFLTILDEYDNPVSWNFYDLRFNIDWNWVVFNDSNSKDFLTTTYEWYKIFRLKSTSNKWKNTINVALLDNDWNFIISESKDLDVLDWININIKSLTWDFNVWWEENTLQIELRDWNWNIIKNFNSRVYLIVDPMYLDIDKPYFEINAWVWLANFKTKTLAWQDIPIEIQVEGLSTIVNDSITILPDNAIKMDLVLSKSRMEANPDINSNVSVELKDKYNNLVFTDNSTITEIEILPEYSHILSSDKDSQVVSNGKSIFKIYGTVNPWVWYFKISTNPSLTQNSFTVEDENWQITINWVGENAWKIETFYVWNKDKISNKFYNSIYTTLLGSNYWDIDTKDYLAWSIIFDKNSKWLAVTSLINNPFSYDDTFGFFNNGAFIKKYSDSDLSQYISSNISFDKWNLFVTLFNNSLNTYIWRVQYNLWDDFDFDTCDKLTNCWTWNKTKLFWVNTNENFKFYTSKNSLVLQNNVWKSLLEVNENWTIERKGLLTFDLWESNSSGLIIDIKQWDTKIASLFYNFVWADIDISRDETSFSAKKDISKNSILIYLNSSQYWSYKNWNNDSYEVNIFYNDPFASDNVLNNFSKWNNYSYENFENKWWLWWYEWNKTLLSFSSWESVWESLKNYASFSSINLWDPVVSLKKIRKKFNNSEEYKQFDSTIWKVLNNDGDIRDYRLLDYNSDLRDDIILIKNDWYIQLLENIDTESNYLDKWNLANIVDLKSTELLKTWDFTWDWFFDIFFVGDDWQPYMLNNISKDFSRLSLYNKFRLDWSIIRAEVFDMDNDGIDDIITLDDAWEINIFYWSWPSANPNFTKLTVSDDYWIKISSDERSDSAYVYFDWLYQLDSWLDNTDRISENEAYLNDLVNQINSQSETDMQEKIDYDLINSIIYEQIAYNKPDNLVDSVSLDDLSNLPNSIDQTTFIRSEYSNSAWVEIKKIYTDRNWWFLASWDIVDIEINIRNNSLSTIENIAYIEDVLEYFTLDTSSIQNSKDLEIKTPSVYDFMIDEFSLSSNETLTINYSVETKALKYWHIQVWLFEDWEAWDDLFWDILLKDNEENCWLELEIFRSTSVRTYQKGIKEPICDDEIPEELSQNWVDENNNWIPDYIEELTWSTQALQDYSEETLNDMFLDSDWDWLPDEEDLFNWWWTISIDLWSLWDDIENWLESVENLINWMSCWFNNWACFASPLNWAPLAPWGDPTFNWMMIWDWLNIDEGLPIFSAITWTPIYVPACVPIPTVWPMSSSAIWSACSSWPAWMDWAWGSLWVYSPTNTFRLFVTPTLTWWIWVAACFWAPPIVAWYSNMPWISPLFPGWNCIVVAKPLIWCSNDWSDWNPASMWQVINWWSFWFINWNCSVDDSWNLSVDNWYVDNYYDHLVNWTNYEWLSSANEAISDHSTAWNWPLFAIAWTWNEISVTVDPNSKSVDFSDITELVQKRIQAFPWFLMNWVTRQIEEIVTKLTDFPTIFVILPDFSWIFDTDLTWEENRKMWFENSWNKNRAESMNWVTLDSDITKWINTDNIENEKLRNASESINSASSTLNEEFKKVDSWIKEAYEFIGSLPLVKIEQEPVDIQVPWISVTEIDKTILTREKTIESRRTEISNFSDSWTYWATCDEWDQECLDKNAAYEKIIVDANALVSSLEANLDAINDYKEIPEKINKLITKKEEYLEQILCNIETISEILGWRIGKNWERFKAWVELYVLIKAILKSWQLLIDVFVDYEEECKECKNERQDLLGSQFELISMVVPDIPVIQFPKWPDIIIDLHNIRAWMTVLLPEFNISTKPILLPELPNLYLPESPSVNISLPSLPVIPTLEIPELPDLPSLPTVELPDLPPPPTLPKMFAQLEAILDVLKLITKAMCILKSSPFHPEWRAWDQIAFLTERNWYLPTDFLNISMPQFSFPFIDAIKVTTYVNLEFETEFIVELARQVAMPINSFTSDFTNLFNISTNDLDFRGYTPSQIDIEIWTDGWADTNIWLNESNNSISELVTFILTKNILLGNDYIKDNKDVTVTNLEFKQLISENLSSDKFTSDPRFDELRELWNNVNNYSYSWENKLIDELQKNNFEKFETLKDIVNTEIIKNKSFKEDFNDIINKKTIKTSLYSDTQVENYNNMLDTYNKKFYDTAMSLVSYDSVNDKNKQDIIRSWEKLITQVNTALSSYTSWIKNTNNLIAANTTTSDNQSYTWNNYLNSAENSCSSWNSNSDYSYVYEWIYIIEDDKSYRLFDYLSELRWDEEVVITDSEKDSDEDLLYLSNGTLYLKNNLDIIDENDGSKSNPLFVSKNDNKFLNDSNFISSVNNVRERSVWSWVINLWFTGVPGIYNYRFSFYTLVDRFLNEDNTSYTPIFRKKSIVDSFAWVNEVTFVEENDNYIISKNVVSIDNLWDLRWVKIETDELKNITNDIIAGKVIVLSNQTKVYSWDSTAVISYLDDNNDLKNVVISKNRNMEVKGSMKVVSITWNAYVKTWNDLILEWTDILSLKWLPLFEWTKISYIGNDYEVRDNTYIDLKYYDGSELPIWFTKISDWSYNDLWNISTNYLLSISRNNDYYYWVINWFKDWLISTSSKQILLSPQIRADNSIPEINFSSIRIPVYQQMDINLTNSIYDNNWVAQVYIDFDLDIDSSWDWDPRNDNDSSSMDTLDIYRNSDLDFVLKLWTFKELYDKEIWIIAIDDNWNEAFQKVKFEVYSPIPKIVNYEDNNIIWNINENLNQEPISLYRYRWWVISKLTWDENWNIVYTQDWEYNFWLTENTTWKVNIFSDWVVIAEINENTGLINLNDSSYNIDVLESNNINNDTVYPKMVLNKSWEELFYQTIKVKSWTKVNIVTDFSGIEENGIYVQFLDKVNYNFNLIPENASYNWGDMMIYRLNDSNNSPLFIIFKDWRINTLNNNYSLKYDSFNDYIVIKLFDNNFNREVASVLYKVDSDFIIK